MRTQTSLKAELFARTLKMGILGVFAVFVLGGIVAVTSGRTALAATSSTINFQARLETATGAIAPDGTYNVEFKLYDAASSGSLLWTETRTGGNQVRVTNGYLSVNLGSVTPFGNLNWNQQMWLTMNIGGTGSPSWDGEMSPRLQLTAVPYAFQAGALGQTDGSGNTGILQFGTTATNPTITLPDATGTVCLQGSSACGFATGSGTAFLQGGNSFGAQAVLGTSDGNSLAFRTNNSNKLVLDTSGNLQLQQDSTFNVASATTGSSLTIQAGAATSGTNVGGNLLLQGGAGASTGASGSVIVKSNGNNSTSAFQVQNGSGANLLVVDTANKAIVLGNDGTPAATTVRGGVATSSNTAGSNITFDASNGTGNGGSGDFIFRTAAPAATGVAYDASSKGDDGGGGAVSSISVSHTVANQSNRVLIVAVTVLGGAALNSTSGVTYNGSNLTKLDVQACPAVVFPGQSCSLEIWYGTGIATGTHNIVATLSSGTGRISLAAASYYNVDQSVPFGTVAKHNGSTSPASQSIASSTTQWVFDALGSDNTITGSNSAGNVRKNDAGVQSVAIQDKVGSASSTTMGWTVASADWAQIGFAIMPAANTSADILADRLHITAAGNVGINTASPQYTLDVAGTANITGPLTLGAASAASGSLTVYNAANANMITIQSGTTSASYTLTLPTAVGASGDCLKASDGTGTLTWGACGGAGGGGVTLQGSTPGTPDTGNINISGTGIAGTALLSPRLDAASSSTLTLGNLNASSIALGNTSSNIATTINGTVLIKPTTGNDSTTAFQVQRAGGTPMLTLDTTNQAMTLTTSNTTSSLLVLDTDATGKQAAIGFSSGGSEKWQFVKDTDDSMVLWDDAYNAGAGHAVLQAVSNGNLLLMGDGSKNVGIGTTNPQVVLEVARHGAYTEAIGSSNNPAIRITNANSSNFQEKAEVQFSVGNANTVDAAISSIYTSWASGGDVGSDLAFSTKNTGGSLSEAMRITRTGLLGIGTVNPQDQVHVYNNTNATVGLRIENPNTGSSAYAQIELKNSAQQFNLGLGSSATSLFPNSFFIYDNTSNKARLVIDSTGNVGIGTTSPASTLDVKGGTLTLATVSTYAFSVGNSAQGDFTIGSDGSNVYLQSWGSKALRINNQGNNVIITPGSGNVGIGNTSPGRALSVTNTTSSGKVASFNNFTGTDSTNVGIIEVRGGWGGTAANSRYIQFYSNATTDTNGTGQGSVDARSGGVTYNTSTADFGEYFTLLSPMNYGDIAVNSADNGTYGVAKGSTNNDSIVGVLSDSAGFVGNAKYLPDGSYDTLNRDVVGLLGQIKTHVSDINGPIHTGDPITVSDIPGFGARATSAGQIVGRAMQDFDPAAGSVAMACPVGAASGVKCGTIMVLVNPSWYDPSTELAGKLQSGNFATLNVAGDLTTYTLTVTSDATFKANIIVEGHIITAGEAPSVATLPSAGVDLLGNNDSTCTVSGNDTSGTVTVTTGTYNTVKGAQCQIVFVKPFESTPHPVVSALSEESADVGIYMNASSTDMTLYFSHAAQAQHVYTFNYWNAQ